MGRIIPIVREIVWDLIKIIRLIILIRSQMFFAGECLRQQMLAYISIT